MASWYSDIGNLFLTAIFYHPLLPMSVIFALFGFIIYYWVNKYLLLRRYKLPEEMSGLMALFIANLIPFFAFLWSLSLLLLYKTMYNDYTSNSGSYLYVPYAVIAFTSLFIILPIRTAINRCFLNVGEDDLNQLYQD